VTLVFIHIPKTAGASFHHALDRVHRKGQNFSIRNMFPLESIKEFSGYSEEYRTRFNLVKGHHAHLLLPKVIDAETITVLRDPLMQFVSSFHHIRRTPQNPRHEEVKNLATIREFIDYCKSTGFSNGQTYHLGHTLADLENNRGHYREVTQADFDRASALLQNINYVLLTEHFHEGLVLLQHELGWPDPVYEWKNKSPQKVRRGMSEEMEREILELQHFDVQLYEMAQKRYQELKSNYQGNLDQAVRRYEGINERFNKWKGPLSGIKGQLYYYAEKLGLMTPAWKVPPKHLR
jgi:hypothetical protein